jgi:hypothetical protein
MIILGIDPGLNGAFAFYDTGEKALMVYDMPTVDAGGVCGAAGAAGRRSGQ